MAQGATAPIAGRSDLRRYPVLRSPAATRCCAARLLPGVAQPGRDPVHRRLDEALRTPAPIEEAQLQERQRIDVWVPQLHRLLQLGTAIEQPRVTGDREHQLA